MAETSFARCRRIALAGLLLQVASHAGLLALGNIAHSVATTQLAWFVLGGVPIWFVTLLIFRQSELAELERMDLDELRRQKVATGGGEAIFDQEGAGGLGYLVAETRLHWMRRWVLPTFGIITGLYLAGMGAALWWAMQRTSSGDGLPVPATDSLPLALIGIGVAMLLMFLLSRFASGMGRIPQWHLLRACGSYALGNVFAAMALLICLGFLLYANNVDAEHILAWVLPVIMVLVGAETLINFVLDIYRPRAAGVEPRAAFDSRLLGLFAEPGGLAASIADAMNYQFGFQVSQTWFYQLLQRALIPLAWSGVIALWLLSSVVVVEPQQRAIIVSWGRQWNPDFPLGPGVYLKAPFPFATAEIQDTDEMQQMTLGRKSDSDEEVVDEYKRGVYQIPVVQWTDPKHGGYDEFNFIVAPTGSVTPAPSDTDGTDTTARSTPVHILRMTVAVQYQLVPERMKAFTQICDDPRKLLREIAWQELVRFNASSDTLSLLGDKRKTAGEALRKRIAERIKKTVPGGDIGLDVHYVGLQDVHPERSVATAFREVISAEQEKLTSIRRALTDENNVLSKIAGDKDRALTLAAALNEKSHAETRYEEALLRVDAGGPAVQKVRADAEQFKDQMRAKVEAAWSREKLQLALERMEDNQALGIVTSSQRIAQQKTALEEARARETAASAELQKSLATVRENAKTLDASQLTDALAAAEGAVENEFWRGETDQLMLSLEGEVAVYLAKAQVHRWELELQAAAELIGMQKRIAAFRAAPEIFKARAYWQTLAEGIRGSRKYIMAFDPGKRDLKLRLNADEQARPEDTLIPTGGPGQ